MPTPRIVSPVMGKSTHSGERLAEVSQCAAHVGKSTHSGEPTGLKCVESARTVVPLLTSDH